METSLRESEERYRSIVDHLDIGIALIDGEHQILMANRALAALHQKPADTLVGKRCFQEICNEGSICSRCPGLQALKSGQPALLETTLGRDDGSQWYAHIRGVPFFLPQGEATGFVLVVVDITERKMAEGEIHLLSRRLLGIAEEERARLARDLHDELGQVLTALQFGMETLKISLPEELEKPRALCQRNIELVAQLGESVRNFSTSLRPAMLDDLGLEAALDWHIRKFCRQRKDLEIDFQAGGLAGRLPREIEIGLYRICQEGLTNIARHAGASHVRIRLSSDPGQVLLSIRDDGMGFDPKPAGERGAGLLGMRERVAALGGNLEIISGSGQGTEIRVEVPLPQPEKE